MNGHADTHTHTNERERFELFRPILNYTSVKGLVSYQEEKKNANDGETNAGE